MFAKLSLFQLALLMPGGSVWGQQINGEDYDSPDGGPPADYFAADASLPVDKIISAVSKLSQVADSYQISTESDEEAQIFSDWASFDDVSWSPYRLVGHANDNRVLRSSSLLTWMSIVMDWTMSVMYANQPLNVFLGF